MNVEEHETDDDLLTMADVDDDEEEEDFEGIDYSDKNLLIQLLMSQQLSAGIPITSRTFDKHTTQHYEVASVSLQGYRDNMEDQHLIHFNLRNIPNCSVFGVFDGHGGDLTSLFIKRSLVQILEDAHFVNNEFDDLSLIQCVKQLDMKWIQFENQRKELHEEQLRKEQEQIEKEAIKFTLDEDENGANNNNNDDNDHNNNNHNTLYSTLIENLKDSEDDDSHMHPMNTMATNEHGTVGSTLVFCIVKYEETQDKYHITTVNLGDSRAILLSSEEEDEDKLALVELSYDHKPENEEEHNRIIKAGGHVQFNRVDGDLALSRAIGDTRYKQNKTLPAEEQKISCVPAITRQTCKSGDYLLVFCDGIVEYKDNEDVFNFVDDALNGNDEEDENEDIDVDILKDVNICGRLREKELDYLIKSESLGLIPKHNVELKGLEKVLLNLTNWALDSGSKDNMTAMMIKIGKTNNNTAYQRIWSPGDFYQYKMQFNNMSVEIKDKDKLTLDRFMRLFEADCTNTGWDLSIKYQNALLQKILYINDLITNIQQKNEIKKLIETQNSKLYRMEAEAQNKKEEAKEKEQGRNEKQTKKKKKKGMKRKKMNDDDGNNEHLNASPDRKKRRLQNM